MVNTPTVIGLNLPLSGLSWGFCYSKSPGSPSPPTVPSQEVFLSLKVASVNNGSHNADECPKQVSVPEAVGLHGGYPIAMMLQRHVGGCDRTDSGTGLGAPPHHQS